MKKNRNISTLVLSTVALQLAIVPAQLNAFRAPDTSKKMQSFAVKKVDLERNVNLKKISQRHLNKKVVGDAAFTATSLAQEIFNNGLDYALSAPIAKTQAANASSFATIRKEQKDPLGFTHIRTVQKYKNIPVVGAEVIIHINNKNTVYMVNGKYQPDLNIDVTPKISAKKALEIGLSEQSGKSNMHVGKQPSLVIYDKKLAWFYTIEYDGSEPGNVFYYVDAKTGKLLNSYNSIKYAAPSQANGAAANVTGNRLSGEDGSNVTIAGFKEDASASNNYFLYSFTNKWGVYDTDAGDWEQQASSAWGSADPAAVSCANNMEATQNYVSTILNRDSFDDNGAFAEADVHVGDNYVNAYWDGNKFNFGDGDGSTSNPLTVLDVSAHEYGHAITQYTSNLEYQNESGALNEAYSDILGTTVEFHVQSDGTSAYPDAVAGESDWLMGEDCWVSSTALRDMKDPQRYNQPSYYMGTNWYTGTGDNGGVHTNSGVANFAFYLLAEGGAGSNDGHDYNITGIGIPQAAAVALRANYVYHTSTTDYAAAREDWIQAAEDLGYNTQTVAAVWTACGVEKFIPTPPEYTISDTAAYAFEDISATGTNLSLGDDASANIAFPFDFTFYKNTYNSVNVNSNGTLSFTSNSTSYSNGAIPNSAFPDMIAVFWDDLNPSGGGDVYWEVKGTAPNRRLIVQWNDVIHFGGSDGGTFEVILYEGSNKILMQYADVNFGDTNIDNGASASVGIQKDSKQGLQYSSNTADLRDGLSILFAPKTFGMSPVYYLLF